MNTQANTMYLDFNLLYLFPFISKIKYAGSSFRYFKGNEKGSYRGSRTLNKSCHNLISEFLAQ